MPNMYSWALKPLLPKIYPFILPIIILAIWEISVDRSWIPSTLVASPVTTFESLYTLAKDGTLALHCFASLRRLILGFSLGTILGIAVGILIGMNRVSAKLLEPTISVIAPIPPITFIPLFIILFGIGEVSKVMLIAFGAFFVVLLHTIEGVRSLDQKFVELSHVLGKRPTVFAAKVVIPSALPHIFTGMRVAMALSWTLLLMAEIIASSNGLGWLIWDSRNFSRPDDMLAGMIVVGFLGRASDLALSGAQRSLTPWSSTYGDWQKNLERASDQYSKEGVSDGERVN